MVRKINKSVKKIKIKHKSNDLIEQEINYFLNIMKNYMEESDIKKINALTLDISSTVFMSKVFNVIILFNENKEKHSDKNYLLSIKNELLKIINDYETNYTAKMITLYYCNLFAINKIIFKYFKKNYFKNRFKKNNDDKTFDKEQYVFFDKIIKVSPIAFSNNRIFGKIWNEKIDEISKKLDTTLNILVKLKEIYLVPKNIIKEYDYIKSTVVAKYDDEEEKLTKAEFNLIKKIFGKNNDIINYYKQPICVRYKTEFNLIKDVLVYSSLCKNKTNSSFLFNELMLLNKNKIFNSNFISELNSLINEILVFFKNFEELVATGDETFSENKIFNL